MKATTGILERQLDLLEEHASHETWTANTDRRASRGEAEDFIALGLETLQAIQRHGDRFNSDPQNSMGEEDAAAEARILDSYWKRWHEIAVHALGFIGAMERAGEAPTNAAEFRRAVNEAEIGANREQVVQALRRMESGGGRLLEDIENELSRQT